MPNDENINFHSVSLSEDLFSRLSDVVTQGPNLNFNFNLSHITVFLGNPGNTQRCRESIVRHANKKNINNVDSIAILGPNITSLAQWANTFPIKNELEEIDIRLQELILVESLLEFPELYKNANPWSLANSLLTLFNQLSLQTNVISSDINLFKKQLSKSYGVENENNPFLSNEATLVHQLWNAMQQQLSASNYLDGASAYRQKLNYALECVSSDSIFYFIGYLSLSPIERFFIQQLATACEVHIITYSDEYYFYSQTHKQQSSHLSNASTISSSHTKPENQTEAFFSLIFNPVSKTLEQRSKDILRLFPSSPATDKVNIFRAKDREDEAVAIQQQIRLWINAGKSNIGFVTNNRKLTRRVRALLERHAIGLKDESGWNLSTTSSAAILEHWMLCLENDFHYLSLLDLIKSPYLFPNEARQQRLDTCYRFENQIILNENISNNINRYINAVKNRQQRLPSHLANHLNDIEPLLLRLQEIGIPLIELTTGNHRLDTIVTQLMHSLEKLGIQQSFISDAAGELILTELNKLLQAAKKSNIVISWSEFRSWLSQKLEQQQFQPPYTQSNVEIVSLVNSHLTTFDAVIISAVEHEYMPTHPAPSPFFNNTVRTGLGLSGDEEHQNIEYLLFRRLLVQAIQCQEGAPHLPPLLITYSQIVNNEETRTSAWLDILTTNHHYFYGNSLYSNYLQDYVDQQYALANTEILQTALPISEAYLNPNSIPEKFSASSYQQLMNCPYQYYVARCLKLEPPEQIREYLQKSDYGELVHLVLQAFHSDLPESPGPFLQRITTENRDEAIKKLKDISAHVFQQHIENNFAHRAWLNQWLTTTPAYIDWLIERQQNWQISDVEQNINNLVFQNNIKLNARLDRIDKQQDSLSIIDYKTGTISTQEKVLNGESVQLPFYALVKSIESENELIIKTVTETSYLGISSEGVRLKNLITDDLLQNLQQQTGQRLSTMVEQLRSGTPLVAWGEDSVCDYCNMEGICRKQYRDNDSK